MNIKSMLVVASVLFFGIGCSSAQPQAARPITAYRAGSGTVPVATPSQGVISSVPVTVDRWVVRDLTSLLLPHVAEIKTDNLVMKGTIQRPLATDGNGLPLFGSALEFSDLRAQEDLLVTKFGCLAMGLAYQGGAATVNDPGKVVEQRVRLAIGGVKGRIVPPGLTIYKVTAHENERTGQFGNSISVSYGLDLQEAAHFARSLGSEVARNNDQFSRELGRRLNELSDSFRNGDVRRVIDDASGNETFQSR